VAVVVVVEAVAVPGSKISKMSCWGIGGCTSNRAFSAIILWNPIPVPSIIASKHAHPIVEFRAAFAPPLIASVRPVKNLAMTIIPQMLDIIPWTTNPQLQATRRGS
jgi:hypothetical protein